MQMGLLELASMESIETDLLTQKSPKDMLILSATTTNQTTAKF
jgi:hypothetical protein